MKDYQKNITFIKQITANDSKSYLAYANKLVVQYNNTYHHPISKKPISADYSDLTEEIEANVKDPKFKVNDRVKINKYKNIFKRSYNENGSREIFIIALVQKSNPWSYKIKDLKLFQKELLVSKL